MQILIKLKEDSKFNKISSSIGTFRKGIISAIDSSKFDELIMEMISEEKEEEPKKEVKKKVKLVKEKAKYTKKELFKLNKKEQIKILEDLGAKKIPRLEKGRVDLILKIQ